jgi:predicted protein tyrosine phosphatase
MPKNKLEGICVRFDEDQVKWIVELVNTKDQGWTIRREESKAKAIDFADKLTRFMGTTMVVHGQDWITG